jgi:hypothetical protein
MGITTPVQAKLFIGMISSFEDLFKELTELLIQSYGPLDKCSKIFPFDRTSYYEDELGKNLKKYFISFENLIEQDDIVAIKHFSNDLEQEYATSSKQRQINLDPGYLTAAKVVLATTKDYSHRLYLNKSIYAEVTLNFKEGRPRGFPWTYPDYLRSDYGDYLSQLRVIYMRQIK